MEGVTIQLDRTDAVYRPGEPVAGLVSWDLDEGPDALKVRLLWQTSGKGSQDAGLAEEIVFDEPLSLRGEKSFAFAGVDGPYSFSGKLITLQWLVEAVVQPSERHAEQSLTLTPSGEEVRL